MGNTREMCLNRNGGSQDAIHSGSGYFIYFRKVTFNSYLLLGCSIFIY